MKRTFITITLFCLSQMLVWADDNKPIQFNQLPQKAQTFVKQFFKDNEVALAKMESDFWSKNYDVIFVNGDKLEFDGSGHWEKIKCRYSQVPDQVIPADILNYIRTNFKESIIELEKDDGRYEVKLSNGLELDFNKKCELININN